MAAIFGLLTGLVLFFSVLPAKAPAQLLESGRSGRLGCVLNHSRRLGGTEMNFTSLTFRNFNSSTTITITGITIYDGNGVARATFPPFPAGFNNVLGPNETSNFLTTEVFGFVDVPGGAIPLQVIVDWTADARGLDLYGTAGRQNRRLDETLGQPLREQRGRATERCVTIG